MLLAAHRLRHARDASSHRRRTRASWRPPRPPRRSARSRAACTAPVRRRARSWRWPPSPAAPRPRRSRGCPWRRHPRSPRPRGSRSCTRSPGPGTPTPAACRRGWRAARPPASARCHWCAARGCRMRQQRVQRAVGVPQREGRVVGEAVRLVHRVVRPAVAAVAVHEQARRLQGVVERGVEAAPLLRRCPRPRPPPSACSQARRAAARAPSKSQPGASASRLAIAFSSLTGGDGHLDHQLGARGSGEIQRAHQLPALDLRALARIVRRRRREALVEHVLLGVAELVRRSARREKRSAKYSCRPGAQPRVSRKPVTRAVAAQPQPRPQHLARVVVHAGAQVDEHVRRPGRRGNV